MTAFLRVARSAVGFDVRAASAERDDETYQVMTLSGTGDAETPAGGSVCMR